ncbi:hypothetical protein RSJ42_16255 [Methanosarcina hadiensis]|uniref:hypothetical protein n=1 Tax=Methanosarcina hadiensis TaxID=3078083 RepID=UPI003977C334
MSRITQPGFSASCSGHAGIEEDAWKVFRRKKACISQELKSRAMAFQGLNQFLFILRHV